MSDATCFDCGAPVPDSQAKRFGAVCPNCTLKFAALPNWCSGVVRKRFGRLLPGCCTSQNATRGSLRSRTFLEMKRARGQ